MKLKITAKCSDLFMAHLEDDKGKQVGEDYSDYVPHWFPNPEEEHYGDYVQLEIDVKTGQILNWKSPAGAHLMEIFKVKNGGFPRKHTPYFPKV